MKTLTLAACFLALPGLALADGFSGTWTGPRGATGTTAGSCAAGGGALSCQRSGSVTGPQGLTATRDVNRTTTATGTTRQIVTTGPAGRSVTSTRARSR